MGWVWSHVALKVDMNIILNKPLMSMAPTSLSGMPFKCFIKTQWHLDFYSCFLADKKLSLIQSKLYLYWHCEDHGPDCLRLADCHAPHRWGGVSHVTGEPAGKSPDSHTGVIFTNNNKQARFFLSCSAILVKTVNSLGKWPNPKLPLPFYYP